eukprot:1107372-Pyramimonas_sp.AAC.1
MARHCALGTRSTQRERCLGRGPVVATRTRRPWPSRKRRQCQRGHGLTRPPGPTTAARCRDTPGVVLGGWPAMGGVRAGVV